MIRPTSLAASSLAAALVFSMIDVDNLTGWLHSIIYEYAWIPIVLSTFYALSALSMKLRSMKTNMFTEAPSQYPDGYCFVSNRIKPEEFRALGESTRQKELELLYRTDEWRAHIRRRGAREENYNWQTRQRLGLPDSPELGA